MKKMTIAGLGLLVCMAGIQSQASLAVYEGFDYTAGDTISAVTGTGTGWNGSWTEDGSGAQPAKAVTGLTFGSVPVVGGAAQRTNKSGLNAMNREVSLSSSISLASGSEMFFSVLMDPGSAAGGNKANTYGTLTFGTTGLDDGSGTSAAPIKAGGDAFGVSFGGTGGNTTDWGFLMVQGVTYSGGTLTENVSDRLTVGDTTLMIVGKVEWNTGTAGADVISLYNVTDPDAALPTAFSSMEVDLNEYALTTVGIGDGQTAIFDEIKMGSTLSDVIPEPATLGLVAAFGGAVLFIRRRFMI
jgi:hypothetical protein